MKKICIKCKVEREEEDFPFQSYVRVDGEKARRTECKTCLNKKRDERRKKYGTSETRKIAQKDKPSLDYHGNEEVRENMRKRSRNTRLKTKYGITQNDYQRMLEAQDHKCKICAKPAEKAIRGLLDIDHCHTTGKIRGLLCTDCNNLLGRAKDDIGILYSAIMYLESHK